MAGIRREFEGAKDGIAASQARSALVDELVAQLWEQHLPTPTAGKGVALVAVGGYGRRSLLPFSDVDLLFCVAAKKDGERVAEAIRCTSKALWDAGLRASSSTRTVADCERFEAGNAELGISLLDRRHVAGDTQVFEKMNERVCTRLIGRDAKSLRNELLQLTRERHARYGDTLFHLEPNVKDCPGGLRDAHVCGWLALLSPAVPGTASPEPEFEEAIRFLTSVRCFLHFRAGRDDNTLDWQAQDAAASAGIGLPLDWRGLTHTEAAAPGGAASRAVVPPASAWMRAYFRHARTVERRLEGVWQEAGLSLYPAPLPRRVKLPAMRGFRMEAGRVALDPAEGTDQASEAEIVLAAFAVVAATGAPLSARSEERIEDALPSLCASLEVGPALWRRLCSILSEPFAGKALRSMHALGLLELILPEFHGIDALVIRDAYHRYTVDEHTFVVIDTLHGLAAKPVREAPQWRLKFGSMVAELQSPGLLYLAALLHDTGKGRSGSEHAVESAKLAKDVLARLEMDPYDEALVLRLIENHLEMSAALRRDIFDAAAVRAFASKVQTPEALRMLTLFTFADIAAVHPDALTPWKAENLWRLSMNAANQLDRNVDDERVHARAAPGRGEDDSGAGVLALSRGRETAVLQFLEGFPERYLKTRTAVAIQQHFKMTELLDEEPFQIALHLGSGTSVHEVTLVTRDRPRLFADMAAGLAAWGMNVVTADAFSNADGVVVDTFRFTDVFRTLELNESESERFVSSLREMMSGRTSAEAMLNSRRRARRRAPRLVVSTQVEFDSQASSHSTVMQVIAQDVPGLLRTVSRTLSALGYNVEVALIDTEGETAIDVFYLTREGERLTASEEANLRAVMLEAIHANAR